MSNILNLAVQSLANTTYLTYLLKARAKCALSLCVSVRMPLSIFLILLILEIGVKVTLCILHVIYLVLQSFNIS
ncbi:hypothetical protein BO85DRAFT_65722 [Aspergillus piperis CBS 112811]|uniref:Uncharacterized protein n=1 Tax=Aspergillus piperis CBS 112811 TaxID=1448313 RepID=A0A8G1VJS7_9EURO|nr:hypothetical protein BO85DRAFT_65722 [Aspergillus piperis CBS 112811]RAH55761.1 hypothetical protein BO85DRAFT_65722 [Aspergillus piperis CBS 112811]